MSIKLFSISPYGQRDARSYPPRRKCPITTQMATVNTTLVTRLENLSHIETPDQLKEVAEAISDFQILKSNFAHVKLSAIKRSLLNLSLDFSEQKLRNAQKELNALQIDIYHV